MFRSSSMSMVLACFFALLCPFADAAVPGDIDNSGDVNAIDIQLVINAALGLDIGSFTVDINFDQAVNAIDIQLVINAALGIDIGFIPEIPPFLLKISADRETGVPGTTFALTGIVTDNASDIVSYEWDFSDGSTGTGETVEISFASSGDYTATVTARDAKGQETSGGILLKIFDPDVPAPSVPSEITPTTGFPGSLVNMTSPALLDPETTITLAIGSAEPIMPFRPELGYATFLIPIDALGEATTTTQVTITVLADDVEVGGFVFELSPLEPIVGEPGSDIQEALDLAAESVRMIETELVDYMATIGATDDETAVLRALVVYAHEQLEEVSLVMAQLLPMLDEDTRKIFEQVANANGLQEGLNGLRNSRSAKREAPAALTGGDVLIETICSINQLAAYTDSIADALGPACTVLTVAAFIPGVNVYAAPLAGGCLTLLAAADIISIVSEIVPTFGDELIVEAQPRILAEGERSTVTVKLEIKLKESICAGSLSSLGDWLKSKLVERMLKRVAGAGIVDKLIKQYPVTGDASGIRAEVMDRLTYLIDQFTGAVLDMSGIDVLLNSFQQKVCAEIQLNSDVQLNPYIANLQITPADIATLTPEETTADCLCEPDPLLHPEGGDVTLSAEREVCGNIIVGSDTLNCIGVPLSITIESSSCRLVSSSDDINHFEVITEGTVTGPLLAFFTMGSDEYPGGSHILTCESWSRQGRSDCQRLEGEPPTTTWIRESTFSWPAGSSTTATLRALLGAGGASVRQSIQITCGDTSPPPPQF